MICPIMSRPVVHGSCLTDAYIHCKKEECMMYRKYLKWQCDERKLPVGCGYCGLVIE